MRELGRTGRKVSLLGLGGAHLGMMRDEAESIRLIHAAVDRGVTFLDNCWDYAGGQSEIRMGKALRDGHRARVFLMTKVDGRTKQAAAGVVTGCDSMAVLRQALDAAYTFEPMSSDAQAALLARTAQAARDGRYERFKTSQQFDGTAENPYWLEKAKI